MGLVTTLKGRSNFSPSWSSHVERILFPQLVAANNFQYFSFPATLLPRICMCARSCSSGGRNRRRWPSWRRQLLRGNERMKRRGSRGSRGRREPPGLSRRRRSVRRRPPQQQQPLDVSLRLGATYHQHSWVYASHCVQCVIVNTRPKSLFK